MSLNAALCELSVKIICLPSGLLEGQVVFYIVFFLPLEILQLLLLNDICEFFSYQLQLLFIKYVNMFVNFFVKPVVS